jgi:Na+/H+-dicarboxylate symporter
MSAMKKMWAWGLGAGAVAASIDIGMILAVEPSISPWALLEVALFWVPAGWFVVATNSGLGRRAHPILITMLLASPWYIVESFAKGKPEHLPPLMIVSIVFGVLFGWARSRARPELVDAATPARGQL